MIDDAGNESRRTEGEAPPLLPRNVRSWISDLTLLAAPVTIGFFALSIFYEWSYFRVVGSEYQSLMSATDYIVNAVLWLPPGVVAILFFIDVPALSKKRGMRGRHDELFIAIFGIPVVLLFLAMLYFLPQTAMPMFAVIFAGAWVIILHYWYKTGPRPSLLWWRIVRAVPPLVFAVFALGYNNGQKALTQIDHVYILKVKSDDNERGVTILRSFDRGLLVRDVLRNRVALFKWDDVITIGRPALGPTPESPACIFFDWNCPSPKIVP